MEGGRLVCGLLALKSMFRSSGMMVLMMEVEGVDRRGVEDRALPGEALPDLHHFIVKRCFLPNSCIPVVGDVRR